MADGLLDVPVDGTTTTTQPAPVPTSLPAGKTLAGGWNTNFVQQPFQGDYKRYGMGPQHQWWGMPTAPAGQSSWSVPGDEKSQALNGLYRDMLGRDVDYVGWNSHVNVPLDQVRGIIAGSPEYASRPHPAGSGGGQPVVNPQPVIAPQPVNPAGGGGGLLAPFLDYSANVNH